MFDETVGKGQLTNHSRVLLVYCLNGKDFVLLADRQNRVVLGNDAKPFSICTVHIVVFANFGFDIFFSIRSPTLKPEFDHYGK